MLYWEQIFVQIWQNNGDVKDKNCAKHKKANEKLYT